MNRNRAGLVLALFLAQVSIAIAQVDTLQIEGPEQVKPGTLVRLTASTTESETPLWIVLSPVDLDYEVADSGRRLLFASGCRAGERVTVLLLAQQVNGERIASRQVRKTIHVISENNDVPVEDPPADPPKKPDFERSPLYRSVTDAWNLIRTDAGKDLSSKVAANFELIANKCESGKIVEIPAIWKELSVLNRQALGIETSAWSPVAKTLQDQFQKLGLSEVRIHAFHLKAISAAIRNAADQRNTETKRTRR